MWNLTVKGDAKSAEECLNLAVIPRGIVALPAARGANARAAAVRTFRLIGIELGIDSRPVAAAALAISLEEAAGAIRTTCWSTFHRELRRQYITQAFTSGYNE